MFEIIQTSGLRASVSTPLHSTQRPIAHCPLPIAPLPHAHAHPPDRTELSDPSETQTRRRSRVQPVRRQRAGPPPFLGMSSLPTLPYLYGVRRMSKHARKTFWMRMFRGWGFCVCCMLCVLHERLCTAFALGFGRAWVIGELSCCEVLSAACVLRDRKGRMAGGR